MDKEITFVPGLGENKKRYNGFFFFFFFFCSPILSLTLSCQIKALSSWDQYLHKRAEKQKQVHAAKKEKAIAAVEATKLGTNSTYIRHIDILLVPLSYSPIPTYLLFCIAIRNVKKKTPETEEDKQNKAELELLVAGDKEQDTGFNMRTLAKEEKDKDKKKKVTKEEDKRQQKFAIDMNDSRFSAIFNNKEYSIDRSNPEYPYLFIFIVDYYF
jgi:hypothetical protein